MVSLLVPVYNRVEELRLLLASFLEEYNQYYKFEVIIIDDKSTDGTLELAQKFCDNNDFCKLVVSGYRSPGISRNLGAKAATNEWLLYCDSDNQMIPKWTEIIKPYLDKFKDFDGIWFPAFSNNKVITSSKYVKKGTHQITPSYYFNNYIGEVVHCVKRDFLLSNNYLYIPGYSNDFPDLLWFELFSKNKNRVVFCSKIIQQYYTNASNRISTEISMNKIESQIIHYSLVIKRVIKTRFIFSKYFFKIFFKLIFYLLVINKESLKKITNRIGYIYIIGRMSQVFKLNHFFYNLLGLHRKKNESIIS